MPSCMLPEDGRKQSEARSSLTPGRAGRVCGLPMDAPLCYHKQLQTTELCSLTALQAVVESGGEYAHISSKRETILSGFLYLLAAGIAGVLGWNYLPPASAYIYLQNTFSFACLSSSASSLPLNNLYLILLLLLLILPPPPSFPLFLFLMEECDG